MKNYFPRFPQPTSKRRCGPTASVLDPSRRQRPFSSLEHLALPFHRTLFKAHCEAAEDLESPERRLKPLDEGHKGVCVHVCVLGAAKGGFFQGRTSSWKTRLGSKRAIRETDPSMLGSNSAIHDIFVYP